MSFISLARCGFDGLKLLTDVIGLPSPRDIVALVTPLPTSLPREKSSLSHSYSSSRDIPERPPL